MMYDVHISYMYVWIYDDLCILRVEYRILVDGVLEGSRFMRAYVPATQPYKTPTSLDLICRASNALVTGGVLLQMGTPNAQRQIPGTCYPPGKNSAERPLFK